MRAQRAGAHDAHRVGVHVGDALPEALQARQRPVHRVLVEMAVVVKARRKLHRFAQPVDHHQLAVAVLGDYQMKAVGSKIDRGQDIGHTGAASTHAAKEDPHPQVVWALGLRITNCVPSRPSR